MPPVAIGSVAAFLVIGLRLRRLAGWAAWGAYSIIAAVATVAVFAAMFLLWRYGVGGLLERLLFVEVLAWYVVFGWRIFRGAASASSPVSGRPVQRSVPSS